MLLIGHVTTLLFCVNCGFPVSLYVVCYLEISRFALRIFFPETYQNQRNLVLILSASRPAASVGKFIRHGRRFFSRR
jgi:hypothetical protein